MSENRDSAFCCDCNFFSSCASFWYLVSVAIDRTMPSSEQKLSMSACHGFRYVDKPPDSLRIRLRVRVSPRAAESELTDAACSRVAAVRQRSAGRSAD